MKKFLGMVAVFAVMSTMALAQNCLTWFVPYGMYTHDATDLAGYSNAIMDKYDVLWQLIWAGPNDVADPIDLTATGFVGGDDVVLGSRNLSSGDEVFDNWLTTPNEDNTSSDLSNVLPYSATDTYYVFQRVYEAQTPVEGTYYYESSLVELDASYAQLSQSIPLSGAVGVQPDKQVPGAEPAVPEPATMSLLGLGALAMVLRRKLRK